MDLCEHCQEKLNQGIAYQGLVTWAFGPCDSGPYVSIYDLSTLAGAFYTVQVEM